MITLSINLFFLRGSDFKLFSFPRWQSVVAITLLGVVTGLDPSMRKGTPELPGLPLFLSIPIAVVGVWTAFLVIVGILKWWMKRGNRWNGQGDMFNLVAASWLIVDGLGVSLIALGVPPVLVLPLWLYSVWIGGNALSGAIPKASLGYAIAGIVIGLLPAMIVSGIAMGLGGIIATMH